MTKNPQSLTVWIAVSLIALIGCADDGGGSFASSGPPGDVSSDVSTSDVPLSSDVPVDAADADTVVSDDTGPSEDSSTPAVNPWPAGDCAEQAAGTGTAVGDIAPNFTMTSQHAGEVSLHDYCDRAVLLIGSAFWCEGCREEAPTLEPLYQEYKDQGLMIITLLTENYDSEPPSVQDLNTWADEYGQTFPVLADEDGYIHTYSGKGKNSVKLPMDILIGPGLEILVVMDTVNVNDVQAALP